MKNKVRVGLIIIGVVITINISLVFSMGSREEKEKRESIVQKEETLGLKGEKAVGEKKQDNAIIPAGEEGKVQYEEYVPEVLIEGKWGKGPGEFGKICHWSLSGDEKTYQPESITVDSKGNIYILDVVNNRIQKFNKKGKYIKSIEVDSYDGELIGYVLEYKTKDGIEEFLVDTKEREDDIHKNLPIIQEIRKPDKVLGINMVIDSKDNLYYYCIRGEKGEVWLFKDDKLVRKWEVAVVNRTVGLAMDRIINELYVYDEKNELNYYVFKNKYETETKAKERREQYQLKRVGKYIIKSEQLKNARKEYSVYNSENKVRKSILLKRDQKLLKVFKKGEKNKKWMVALIKDVNNRWHYYYNEKGEIFLKKELSPTAIYDRDKNCYRGEVADNGYNIIKFKLKRRIK